VSRPLSGLSVVVPVYDEEENVGPLAEELAAALSALELPWEVIFVDDGSRDGTRKAVLESVEHRPGFRLVPLDRNQGQSAALVAREHDVVIGRRASATSRGMSEGSFCRSPSIVATWLWRAARASTTW